MILQAMICKFCVCSYPIGIDNGDPPQFYDSCEWEKPVSICPSCNEFLVSDRLDYSEEQKETIFKGYRILLEAADRRRARKAAEAARELGSVT